MGIFLDNRDAPLRCTATDCLVRPKFQPRPPLSRGNFFFSKIEWFSPWVRGKASTKNEVERFHIFWDKLNTDTVRHTYGRTDTQMQSNKPHPAKLGRDLLRIMICTPCTRGFLRIMICTPWSRVISDVAALLTIHTWAGLSLKPQTVVCSCC